MEQIESEEQPLVIDEEIKNSLLGTAKWAKFLAIIGIIFSCLIVVLAFSMGSILTTIFSNIIPNSPTPTGNGTIFTITYLILAIAYFIPSLYLLKFAIHTKKSLSKNNQDKLTSSLYNLNRFFRFIGILTAIYLVIILLSITSIFLGGIFGSAIH